MLKSFKPALSDRVLVIGDVILDRYLHGTTTRISPEAPVPVVKVQFTEERPGGAANVALNIRSLGVNAELIGVTGDDIAAEILQRQLEEKQVQCRFARHQGFPTITKMRVMSQHQQLIRLDYEAEPVQVDKEILQRLYTEAMKDCTVIVLSDYAKGSLQDIETYIRLARDKGIKVLVDPKGDDFSRYRHASVLTPNLKEFEAVVGSCRSEEEITAKGKSLCKSLAIEALLVTRGEHGMTLLRAGPAEPVHLNAEAHEVFDVTGAGDTVIATLAAAIASDYALEDAIQYANYAAGLVVEKLGTSTVTVDELNAAIQPVREFTSHVVSVPQLLEKVAQLRARGKKLVFTNGCFDLLHAGHVQYLQQARLLGDALVVAVNDDESVQRLKGPARPITPLARRMTVLAGLASVDWVVSFAQDTPEQLIQRVQPDVLVKGGDYQPAQIAGADFVKQHGGMVVVLPFHEGCSTTDMVNSIKQQAAK